MPDFLQIWILATESHEPPPFTAISLPLFSPPYLFGMGKRLDYS